MLIYKIKFIKIKYIRYIMLNLFYNYILKKYLIYESKNRKYN